VLGSVRPHLGAVENDVPQSHKARLAADEERLEENLLELR
jgi:hypothetical protein